MATGFRKTVIEKASFHLLLVALLGVAAYSNSLDVPFQWDDERFIGQNPLIKDLSYFSNHSKAQGSEFYGSFKVRFIGYLSFALNYAVHGPGVRGYHITNIAIHLLNAMLVYFFVVLIFETPYLKDSPLYLRSKGVALSSALLFVAHPVQTEAVTYVFQRLASLAALFYLGAAVFYLKWRLSAELRGALPLLNPTKGHRPSGHRPSGHRPSGHGPSSHRPLEPLLYFLSLVFAVLAMKTKENAFTLPFALLLIEFIFLRGKLSSRMLRLLPFLLTLLIIPLSLTGVDRPVGEIIGSIGPSTRGYSEISRGDYLVTQFRVVVTYIRLLFIPAGQNIDYDYQVYGSFFDPGVFLSFLFLFSVFAFAVYLLSGSRARAGLRLPAFGVFWFFLTLSVESSVVPIPMVINEYRLYLPSAGAFTALAAGGGLLLERVGSRRLNLAATVAAALIILLLAGATYRRNSLWANTISLWEDVVRKSPNRSRGHYNLGISYKSRGLKERAEEEFLATVKLDKYGSYDAHFNLGEIYMSKAEPDRAIKHYESALMLKPDLAEAHNALGIAYMSRGLPEEAIEHYKSAISLKPDYAIAHNNLGNAYTAKGIPDGARAHYERALRLDPDYADAHYNLGILYMGMGLDDKARAEFEAVLKINPNFRQAEGFLRAIRK